MCVATVETERDDQPKSIHQREKKVSKVQRLEPETRGLDKPSTEGKVAPIRDPACMLVTVVREEYQSLHNREPELGVELVLRGEEGRS